MPESPYLFVSYASADRERVLAIVDRLEAAGVKTWIDREGIHGGTNYAEVIGEAIKGAAALLLMASPASLASRNVRQELALAWRYETPYLPLLLEPVDIPDNLAYWLEGSQWIEVLDHPEHQWLDDVAQALQHVGITLQLPTGAQALPTASLQERPLVVGREREQSLLRQQLDRMLAGRGSVVLVGGEAGIGKTTLVQDLSVEAEEAGALVLWGHANDLSVTPPYGPWLEIFRQYQHLASNLPPVPAFVGNAEELAKVGSQETLFAAVADFFSAVAVQRPLLLVLDDLHWADPASLDFFRVLSRQVSAQRMLLVTTYRSDELTRRHPLYTLMPLLVRETGAKRLEVRPLNELGHRALIQARYTLAEPDEARLERYLAERTEGNPLYVGELLRTLEDEGLLAQQDGVWTLGDLDQARVPLLVRQLIEARIGRFDEENQRQLGIAAVIGQIVPVTVWAQAGEVDEDRLLDLAERADEARLLEGTPDGRSVYFCHALIREALYEGIPSFRRRRLHRQIGELLAATGSPDPDIVAHHFQQAGDVRAADWLIKAGERAEQAYDWQAAFKRLDVAVALLTDDPQRCNECGHLLYRIGRLQRFADPARSMSYYDQAEQIALGTGDQRLAELVTLSRNWMRCYLGDIRLGLEGVEQALRQVDSQSGWGATLSGSLLWGAPPTRFNA